MAASRRGQPPLSVRLPEPLSAASVPDLPPTSALFLIDFDIKAGYTIAWKRAVPGLELDGVVEYKSLPSGLHTVSDDLIYFVHDAGHAGLSAFVNTPTDDEETRHARMIAVGVLVPLSCGRLGRAWRHAEGLKAVAAELAADRKQTRLLEEYWDKNGLRDTTAPQPLRDTTPLESPLLSARVIRPGLGKGHARNRSASDGAALIPPGHRLSPFHPAWSLTSLLDTFGPLIFPIHRAALLRKRILISCHAPVHEVCNFVYDISVLSSIPLSVCDVIDPSAPVHRLRPLFTIGVHDLTYLLDHQAARKRPGQPEDHDDPSSADETGSGWVACTTDSILAMKEGLWDMLITMPPPYSSNAKHRVWPSVECPKGVPVKATQRDLRRFRSLRVGLARLAAAQTRPGPQHNQARSPRSEASESPAAAASGASASTAIRLSRAASGGITRPGPAGAAEQQRRPTTADPLDRLRSSFSSSAAAAASSSSVDGDDTDAIVEPTTWAALAYNGFMWWASAGEQGHSDEVDEHSRDAALLADLAPLPAPASPVPRQQFPRPQRTIGTPGPGGRRVSDAGGVDVGGDGNHDGQDHDDAGREEAGSRSGGLGGDHDDRDGTDGDGADEEEDQEDARARLQLAVVAYFHRLTTAMLSVLADIVDSSDEDDLLDLGPGFDLQRREESEGRREGGETRLLLGGGGSSSVEDTARGWHVRVDSEALAEMGLDVWSQADADFVRELSVRYFSRRAHVETKGVEVCGVRVC